LGDDSSSPELVSFLAGRDSIKFARIRSSSCRKNDRGIKRAGKTPTKGTKDVRNLETKIPDFFSIASFGVVVTGLIEFIDKAVV
jgi:hypothetical protein